MRSSFVRKSAAFEFARVGLGEAEAIGIGDWIGPDRYMEHPVRRTAVIATIRMSLKPAPW
jgi:hypothetical protein